jgi:hypothetical protein
MSTVEARRTEIEVRYAAEKRDKPQRAGINGIRRAELGRLFTTRYGRMLSDDDAGRDDAFVMAHHLARRAGDARRNIAMWLELNAPWMDGGEVNNLITSVLAKPLRWKADTLAKRLGLTAIERTALGLTTIGAIDQTKEEREAERRDRKRERDRLRRQHHRLAEGAKPRAQYEAQSLIHTKPWLALGMSRAAWYRAGKPG